MTWDPTQLYRGAPSPPASPAAGSLVCLQGPSVGARWSLGDGPVVVGRDPEADVSLDLETVSWHHCELVATPDGCRLRDLGSTNGTQVDGRTVDTARLHGGETIRVGGAVLKYLDAGGVEAAYHEALERRVEVDALTGVWNRRRLFAILERERARAHRHGRPLHLMMLDVDHFKRINDAHGHPAGDAVLRELVARVGETVRETELLARYGGEEFAVVVPESPTAKVVAHAEKIRARVAAAPFAFDGERLEVTVSIGVAALPPAPAAVADLLGLADRRLYAAKAAGRNRVVADDAPGRA